ncbi:MAG TPA: hypothetical protein VLG91_08135 [Streptomyces sp.]|jgi:hypothetical protein|nr:hypothetical protein [Streptomyces sp.]
MDADGLLHLLDARGARNAWGLRVLFTGWQPQPQQHMAEIAGIAGPGSATGERYPMAGSRRRVHRVRDSAYFGAGWLPRA